MKKRAKKLVLAKETLQGLEDPRDLRQIWGATLQDTYCYGCYSGGAPGCYPSYNTCATRLC